MRPVASLTVAAMLIPAVLSSQQSAMATLSGRVIDQTDSGAVAHATINVLGTDLFGYTDGWGYFRIRGIRPGDREIVIKAIGYAKLIESQRFANGEQLKRDFTMMRLPHTLTQMVIL
ncbi:MAG TPA: carboxypeptidase-like regulatory domain-containing protein, partial [Gemmatimonadales bacterium]|nr:carboxypeptidase-like regulatory domain-containing protein [Gemmatimonadales bacterium]